MKIKKQYALKFMVASSFLILTACSDETSIEETSQEKNSVVVNEVLNTSNGYTFDFTPNVTRIVEDVSTMNVGNKKAIVNAALSVSNNNNEFAAFALAIAMQETRVLTGNTGNENNGSEYPWRDSKASPGNDLYKVGESSCFGVYKMNWYMIRHSNTIKANNNGNVLGEFAYGSYGNNNGWGERINDNIGLATRILYDYWGTFNTRPNGTSADGNSSLDQNTGKPHNFWGGHRFGKTGWNDWNANFYGGTIARNTHGWQNTINYWYAIRLLNNEIDGQLQNFKTTKRRIAYLIENI